MEIEVLHVENCPHLPKTLENLKLALQELNITEEIKQILVRNQAEAEKIKFLGSTSIRINGKDIVPLETNQYVLT
jgi:hypothetical protein